MIKWDITIYGKCLEPCPAYSWCSIALLGWENSDYSCVILAQLPKIALVSPSSKWAYNTTYFVGLLQSGAFQTVGHNEFWNIFNWSQQCQNVSHVKYWFYETFISIIYVWVCVYWVWKWNLYRMEGWDQKSLKGAWSLQLTLTSLGKNFIHIYNYTCYVYILYIHREKDKANMRI